MKILFVASDRAEAVGFPREIRFLFTGVGQSLAAALLAKAIADEAPELIINVGSSGGIGLEVGTVKRVGKVYNLDQDLTSFKIPLGNTLTADGGMLGAINLDGGDAVLASSGCFASSVSDGMREYGVMLTDMEAYSEALVAREFGIPFRSYKVVTDIVGVKTEIKDYRKALKEYRSALASFVLKELESEGKLL
jgi:Nucleoside phosphorylase